MVITSSGVPGEGTPLWWKNLPEVLDEEDLEVTEDNDEDEPVDEDN